MALNMIIVLVPALQPFTHNVHNVAHNVG